MDFLKKLRLPVALKSEPAQPQAQPEPEPQKAPPEQRPPVQASAWPQPQAAPQVRQRPAQPPLQQTAQPQVQTQTMEPPPSQFQPQAPVWAKTGTQVQRQPLTRAQVPPQPLKIAPRVVAAQAAVPTHAGVQAAQPLAAPQPEARVPKPQPQIRPLEMKTVETEPAETKVTRAKTVPGAYGPTGHLSNAPGFWRTVWAMHPNRTKRRLRKLLLSWEKLGAYISSPGAGQELTPAGETAFLRAKIDIARSVGYLKLLDGAGGIAKEADQKEAQFIELLERFPSLHSAWSAGEAAKRNLYYNWHELYLFLHKMLGASPYEVRNSAAAATFGHRMETVVAAGRATSAGGKRTG